MSKEKLNFFLLSICAFSVVNLITYLDLSNISSINKLENLVFNIYSSNKPDGKWLGDKEVSKDISILVLAGHADSQGNLGSGTRGEAVSIYGENPMSSSITDELFWNLLVIDEITKIGKERGLNINSYDPAVRNIIDENDPRTNWSVGAAHAKKGGYSIEIHFDSYGKYGIGSGLIPPLNTPLNNLDEYLARNFGRFPLLFRGGLGAPRRNIRILEIAKLEGDLERNLRNPKTRDRVIKLIATRVIDAISLGLGIVDVFNPTLDEKDIFLPAIYL